MTLSQNDYIKGLFTCFFAYFMVKYNPFIKEGLNFMKRLKIFSYFKKNTTWKLKLVSFACTGLVFLTSCGTKLEQRNKVEKSSTSTTLSMDNDIKIPSLTICEVDDNTNMILGTSVKWDEELVSLLEEKIDAINIEYPQEEYYNVQANLEKYKKINDESQSESTIIENNQITFDKLYTIVKENNARYLKENSHLTKYNNTTDAMVQDTVHVLVNYLNRALTKIDTIDYNALDQKLKDLKVFECVSGAYAYYDYEHNIIGVDSNVLKVVKETSNDPEAERKVREHEVNHLIQAHTPKELATTSIRRFGPCYLFNQDEVNSLYWNWFFEGCAEQLVLDLNASSKPIVYANEISILNTIKASTILNSNNNVSTLEELSLQKQLEKIFTYFSCNNELEQEEIVKMFYAINLYLRKDSQSSSKEFYEQEKVKEEMEREYASSLNFENQLKGAVGSTLARQFYKNLTHVVTNQEISVKEIFNIISIEENELSHLLWYTDTSRRDDLESFFKNYTSFQNAFFDTLSSSLGLTTEEIKEAYEVYHGAFNEEEENMPFLSEEKNTFYQNLVKERRTLNSKKSTIQSIYQSYLDQKVYTLF